jgi:hypothetical protein
MINLKYLKSITKNIVFFLLLSFFGCNNKDEVVFKAVSKEISNISFSNQITETDDLSILDYLYFYNGGGVAIGDINNDNLPDIFFSGNQVKNKLYLNKGNLKFEDISKTANIKGNSSWNTGAVMGDINGDGLLDIYVCAVVGINGFTGFNELYINKGNGKFIESATEYGLDFDSFSSTAAFIDYDLDGDLDLYLLNHAVHTQESFGKANLRNNRSYQTGDKLLKNNNGKFVDVSEQAGIFGGINGYGLGIAVSDFNKDGFPDIYVGNDFHEDDYYYLNNGNGTFTNQLKRHFGHTSRFSMGNDVTDINHDGLPDLLTLDMLAADEKVLKTSVGDEGYQIQKLRIEQYGYYYQHVRNMLQVNQINGNFKETGVLSGLSATDWSWSALFADYNQDGEQDVFITNGILKRPNDLDYINYVSNDQIVKKIKTTKLVDKEALSKMPNGKVENMVFMGKSDLKFENKSNSWIANNKATSSTAMAIGDLDNDGDLDLVINNVNEQATIYQNQTNTKRNYLKLKLDYIKPNSFGIGTKVYAYNKLKLQFKELYTVRGFQSSSEPIIHFGFDSIKKIDSLRIVWPNRTTQILKNIEVNQTLIIKPNNTKPFVKTSNKKNKLFKKVPNNLGINFTHKEDNYIDFMRQKLIPYRISDKGPAVAIGDLNNDNKEDVFFGSSKFNTSKVFVQQDSIFIEKKFITFANDSIKEEVSAVIDDFNNDGKKDLFLATGGGDFYGNSKVLQNSFYVQKQDGFVANSIPLQFENASTVKHFDFDNDGDLDVFVGNYAKTNDFGSKSTSSILINSNGVFSILKPNPFENIGMVTDAVWTDFDNDGLKDLIVIGEWMSPTFFKNNNGKLVNQNYLNTLNGLWQTIEPFDIDKDGDMDYLLGNWGINTKFKASEKFPLKMYYADFDGNGQSETIVCTEKDGDYYPILGLDELASQLVFLKKKFTSYKQFAGKPIHKILNKKMLDKAEVLKVEKLKSGYLKNNNGNFKFVPFKNELQVAPITSFLKYDFYNNKKEAVLVGGNYFGVTPFHGRFNAFSGAIIKDKNNIELTPNLGMSFSNKAVKNLSIIHLKNEPYLMVTFNNKKVEVYEISK